MLDLDENRPAVPPRDAATLLLVRDAPQLAGVDGGGGAGGVEVFCVERHKKSGFLGGAIVFPGGKLDAGDADPAWSAVVDGAPGDPLLRALKVAACREALEEAAILPVVGGALGHDALVALRTRIDAKEEALDRFLAREGLRLDLARLHLFARWITPEAEARRFDTRFFVAVAPEGQPGAHDEHETTSSFWARPSDVLARFAAGEVQLAPPTHRTLEIFAASTSARDLLARAARCSIEPICPRLVRQRDASGETMALVLPGDPEHSVAEVRAPGRSRFVLRGDRFLPEDPPAA